MDLQSIVAAALLLVSPVARGDRCIDDRLVLAPAGPWQVSVNAGAGIGVFFATHGRVGLAVGRRFYDRIEVELSLHYGGSGELDGHEEAVRIGVLLHFSRRWNVLLGWRVGHARFHKLIYDEEMLAVSSLVASVLGELRVSLSPQWGVRFAPLVFTGYWNEIWGFTVEPSVGVAYRF